MARAPLVVPASAFLVAIVADAHALAAPACAVALPMLLHGRTRVVGAFALAGLVVATRFGHPPMIERESRTARFSGAVVGDVRSDGDGAAFAFALDGGPRVRVRLRHGGASPGDRLVLRGRCVPFDEARNPGEPSRRAVALAEGLAGELDADRVVARAPPDARDVRTWGARVRNVLATRLRSVVREPEATVIAGALWGERGTLPQAIRDDFQATATVHVLVTAGLHLGVVAGLVLAALRLAGTPRVAASLGAIPCVAAYAWVSGGHLPSQRAAVMVSVALLAAACGARFMSWNALALAALVVAAIWPASVGSLSFALSFSCLAAIGLFAKPIARALERSALPARVREALALTIATQIGVWPLSAATFGVVAPYAVLANAVVVPGTGLAMIAGLFALAVAGTPFAGLTAGALAALIVDVIVRVVAAVASLPLARVWIAAPPVYAIVAYDVIAVAAAAMLRRRPRTAGALLAIAAGGVLACTIPFHDGRLTVTMLDVGQGDGIVVHTPRGHVLLIDSGGRLERGTRDGASPAEIVGERVVVAYLKRHGYRTVDVLLNSHPHGDHVGGFAPAIRALHVLAVADSGQRYGGRAFNDGLREAAAHGVPVRIARCGDRWSSDDGVTLTVLSPCGALLADGKNDVNENSIVAMLQYGAFRMLFTGDAGFETEQRLLARALDLHADVLKVGHHGSAYASSPAFVAAVHPRIAVISVGRHNTFGHPAPSTLATLRRAGARTFRTDECGAVSIDAEALTVHTILDCDARAAAPQR